jgi:hypothetical protein
MSTDNALQAFSNAAGISANDLSLFIRITLLTGMFIWSTWCAIELMKFHKKHRGDNVADLLIDYVQLFFLVSIAIALVFIP